ncbi:MAG: SAM-dependent methyltransferase [Deltaproteobacteria bacterium]|nr:SAM-dependent methyltransferase [Deltaproteobacteria bacterium]
MQNDVTSPQKRVECPHCHRELPRGKDAGRCPLCHASLPIEEEGRPDTIDVNNKQVAARSSEEYSQNYQKDQAAATYNVKYRACWTKRMTTRREHSLLDRLLRSQGRSKVLLDLPCGGGRLSSPMAPHTDLLIEADVALGQLRYLREHGRVSTEQAWMLASGFQIPLCDASVDGTVCVRLTHHLPKEAERQRLVRELLRVSKRFVIVTFFDYHSVKNTLRRLSRPFNRKSPKSTMRVEELRRLAEECGARLVEYPALSLMWSGHRYALMVKDKA